MTNQKDKSDHSTLNRDRRDFINRVGKASLSVPATALLVSVANKRAHAETNGYGNDENWEGQTNGEPVIRTYDRGGVVTIMEHEGGGKGDGR